MVLFLAFILVPIIEIALFIQIGGAIGTWPTLAVVVLTAILGTWLVKSQGRMALGQIRRSFDRLDDPTLPLAHGAMILVSGVLLLTPGFFTDAVGFALLMPPVRVWLFHYLRSRFKVQTFQQQPDIVDAEFEEIEPGRNSGKGPSGWTERH